MAGFLFLVVSFAALAPLSLAFNCSIPPIYVDIHRRVVHGTNIFQYGSFIGVGSPDQNQSLWPSFRQNETSVAFIDYCEDSTLPNCLDATRGNFDPSQSETWIERKSYESWDQAPVGNESIYGTDALHLYTHFIETDPASEIVVTSFPLEVATSGDISPGVVGLGTSSTVLQELFNQNLIAGRTYSLYVGTGMDRAGGAINGSNTFGGYDQGRFKGPVHSYLMDITDPNPLNVSVTDIFVENGSGEKVSLFDADRFPNLGGTSPEFTARLTTDQYPMSLPYEITQNFMTQLGGEESDHPDGSLRLSRPFEGSLSFVLSDGFTVTLPSETVYNASGLSPVAARAESSDDDFFLSLAWLSQVYVMMDYDSYTFHLAQAVVENEFVTLQTFCPKAVPVLYEAPHTPAFTQQGLVGAVVGGVIGGLALIAASITGYVVWVRRRAMRAEEKEVEKAEARAKSTNFEMDVSTSSVPVLQGSRSHNRWFGTR